MFRYPILFFLTFVCVSSTYGQKFETNLGTIKNLEGIRQYKIVFEYAENLEIPNYNSEDEFLQIQINKREKENLGSGEKFKVLWFENRANLYEPTFIQKFNDFRLKNRHVTVSKNYQDSDYTMVMEILLIYPGYSNLVWEEVAKLEVSIKIYQTNSPDTIIYSTKPFFIHGNPGGDEFDMVKTAYGELGRWTSKFFCRKTQLQ